MTLALYLMLACQNKRSGSLGSPTGTCFPADSQGRHPMSSSHKDTARMCLLARSPASSENRFSKRKKRFRRAAEVCTDALGKLFGRKQSIGFDNCAFATHPFRFDGVEPGTFRRKPQGQDVHATSFLFDLLIVFSDPGPHNFADMPGAHYPKSATRSACLAPPAARSTSREIGW